MVNFSLSWFSIILNSFPLVFVIQIGRMKGSVGIMRSGYGEWGKNLWVDKAVDFQPCN